ncbi:DJ-1/PfpI family protein [Nocardia bhagyanarayanae]|uniref:DJ-1/PfpI family protein n=1 Tax=Nocardia bhagyanarayanae TaxID=1215925 RepID=A0A543FF36_9NOCA|nr:DJ-1/PfpI family protein [Nocardia bhagyanarayanae]TQM32364.1 DJ-1/PfpI family protein [Nocardia bhagyanarayanae]
MTERLKRIGILLFPGVEELDAIGPWEILSCWTEYFPGDGYEVFTFTDRGDSVECAKGMTIIPHHSLAAAPARDVLVYPGGRGTRPMMQDSDHLAWVRAQRATTPLIASVCTGALVLAAAGLLAGRPATTHWRSIDRLASVDPTIEVRPGDRYVDDGDIITAAGVSAGLDMSLRLVQRLAGTERARQVRRIVQYDPEPPAGTEWTSTAVGPGSLA